MNAVRPGRVPAEYRSVVERGIQLVAREDAFGELYALLFATSARVTTLYEWARRTTPRPPLMGRGPAYAATLPQSGIPTIVRHNRHGGFLAPITGDRFLPPTNAPSELAIARRLLAFGVATAEVVAYAVYPAGLFRRADVLTVEIGESRDLSVILMNPPSDERERVWRATARLLASMTRAGARHRDLNVKNILLRPVGGELEATVLDVDRVEFGAANDSSITGHNLDRLARSADKWRRLRGAHLDDVELSALRETVAGLVSSAGATLR